MNGPVPIGFEKSVVPSLMITVFCCRKESKMRAFDDFSGTTTVRSSAAFSPSRLTLATDAAETCSSLAIDRSV